MTDQIKIAQHISEILTESKLFDSVELCGSVTRKAHDNLSDIDILVSRHDRSPKDSVELASLIIEAEFGVVLRDWSLSLLPDKYLLTHFLPEVSIFWWLDIGCFPNAAFASLYRDDISHNENTHIAKLWVMNAKHMIRGTESRLRIKELYIKVFGAQVVFPGEIAAFEEVFNSIDFAQIEKGFHSACAQIMGFMLSGDSKLLNHYKPHLLRLSKTNG